MTMAKPDEITLILPRERGFSAIANLVLGGVATRLSASLENLDDLQIALESLLEQEDGDEEITVRVRVVGDSLETRIGPFGDAVGNELASTSPGLGLRRILDTVADSVSVGHDSGAHWIELRKRLTSNNGGA